MHWTKTQLWLLLQQFTSKCNDSQIILHTITSVFWWVVPDRCGQTLLRAGLHRPDHSRTHTLRQGYQLRTDSSPAPPWLASHCGLWTGRLRLQSESPAVGRENLLHSYHVQIPRPWTKVTYFNKRQVTYSEKCFVLVFWFLLCFWLFFVLWFFCLFSGEGGGRGWLLLIIWRGYVLLLSMFNTNYHISRHP